MHNIQDTIKKKKTKHLFHGVHNESPWLGTGWSIGPKCLQLDGAREWKAVVQSQRITLSWEDHLALKAYPLTYKLERRF